MSVFATTSKASASFENPGDQIAGHITEIGEPFHANKYQSQDKDYWPSGDPIMNVTVTLKTDQRDRSDPDDEGLRRIFITVSGKEGGQLRAIKDAVRAAGQKDLAVGGYLTVQFTDYDPESGNPKNPRKLYRAAYQAPAAGGGVFSQEQAASPAQQQAPAQQWQQPAQQAAPQGAPGWAQPPAQQQPPAAQAPQQWQQPQQINPGTGELSPERQQQVDQAQRVAQNNGWHQPQQAPAQQDTPPAQPQGQQGGGLNLQAIAQMIQQGASDQDVQSVTGAGLEIIQTIRSNVS